MRPSRNDAFELFCKYNKTSSLINHAKTVEAIMRHFAKIYGEDEDLWGIIGLLHDLDYEMYPQMHCQKTDEILTSQGYDGDIIRAILSHGYGICTDIEPLSQAERTLYTIDELSGLIYAAALMRPTGIKDMQVKSVKKKFKDKAFAAGVNRNIINDGIQRLNSDLDAITIECIKAMQNVACEIGLEVNKD